MGGKYKVASAPVLLKITRANKVFCGDQWKLLLLPVQYSYSLND